MAAMNNKIKEYRARFKLTQEELADRVGVTRQTIIAIEKNHYVPSLALAFRIANAFKEKIEGIFEYKK
jgi:putative transcriptional regulator